MTKEQIKQMVEDEFEAQMYELGHGCEREDVEEVVLLNMIANYQYRKIGRDDLLACAEYMGTKLDMVAVDKMVAKYWRRKELQAEKKAAKLAAKKGV